MTLVKKNGKQVCQSEPKTYKIRSAAYEQINTRSNTSAVLGLNGGAGKDKDLMITERVQLPTVSSPALA